MPGTATSDSDRFTRGWPAPMRCASITLTAAGRSKLSCSVREPVTTTTACGETGDWAKAGNAKPASRPATSGKWARGGDMYC